MTILWVLIGIAFLMLGLAVLWATMGSDILDRVRIKHRRISDIEERCDHFWDWNNRQDRTIEDLERRIEELEKNEH